MRKYFWKVVPAIVGTILISSAAWAHPRLLKSVPASGSQVAQAPTELVLHFSEDVEPSLSKVEVKGEDGKVVSEGKPEHAGDTKDTLRVALQSKLGSGKYHVSWRATSVDTHHLKGEFTFSVQGKE